MLQCNAMWCNASKRFIKIITTCLLHSKYTVVNSRTCTWENAHHKNQQQYYPFTEFIYVLYIHSTLYNKKSSRLKRENLLCYILKISHKKSVSGKYYITYYSLKEYNSQSSNTMLLAAQSQSGNWNISSLITWHIIVLKASRSHIKTCIHANTYKTK